MSGYPTIVCGPNGIIRPCSGASVDEILHILPELNAFGFRCYGRNGITDEKHAELRAQLLHPEDHIGGLAPRKAKCLHRWLRPFLPTNRQWRHNSYGLKHVFERETGVYLINGAFIVGVLQDLLTIKIESDSTNCLIAARRPSL